ncbi:MAG: hypothetical protein CL920_23150 [Deltaproteobacteria bacterium]|nr:hypothetical protein [Deltaproteobacteria bacterium]MBU51600.1 hypothetical protein [Deltaproteobacteria bacterium]|tara:strand:- start:17453 stop:19381 length:1929 start_codon:yes stop_codon:yes gene_type:complete
MKEHAIQGQQRDWALQALQKSQLFGALGPKDFEVVLSGAKLFEYEEGEVIVKEGEQADSGFLVLHGEGVVTLAHHTLNEQIEVNRIYPSDVIGEMGLLLEQPRTATIIAATKIYLLKFAAPSFDMMIERINGFAKHLSKLLAKRLIQTSRQVPLKEVNLDEIGGIEPSALHQLPIQFIQRHRILPLRMDGNVFRVGFVDDPDVGVLNTIKRMLPGAELRVCNLSYQTFQDVLRTHGFEDEAPQTQSPMPQTHMPAPSASVVSLEATTATPKKRKHRRLTEAEKLAHLGKIKPLLQRMVSEGASDLHLCAKQKPRWRIDGDLIELSDSRALEVEEVYDMLHPLMPERSHLEFEERQDTDFSYSIQGLARYRVNMYEDENGVSAALRSVPLAIPTIDQLKLPPGVPKMSEANHGLVLVTGPTGSGKSTTLAALINQLNEKRAKHIITLEDPVEFVHPSKKSLVNQREIGTHARSFADALKAAMREDPDIILVGELRDRESMMLALETANTGHLVFGTLHTNTALSTIDRIIDMFPADQHTQISSTLSDVLVGIVSQILLKKKSGGRVAAFEVLLVNQAISSLIRQGKSNQIINVMGTERFNLQLNTHLEQLVRKGHITGQTAMDATSEPEDLRKRLPAIALRNR